MSNKLGYYPGKNIKNNVFSFLERHEERNANFKVLQWATKQHLSAWDGNITTKLAHDSIAVGDFADTIRRVAAGYLELGLRENDRAIVFLPMSVQLYCSMFALQLIGAIPVFLDSWARRSHLGVSAQVVTPKAMISFEKAFELCADVPELNSVPIKVCAWSNNQNYTSNLESLMSFPKQTNPIAVEQEHTALITFTTGSSGVPKGANRTHRFLAAQHYAINACIPYEETDVDLPAFPIFSLNNIAAGVSTVIPAIDVGVPTPQDPKILMAQVRSCGITCMTLSPSLLNGLSAFAIQNNLELTQLRRVAAGGAPVSNDNVRDFKRVAKNSELWILYGSTEVEPIAHIEGNDMLNTKARSATDPRWVDDGVNVGHFTEGIRYKLIKIQKGAVQIKSAKDWETVEVPPGTEGELIVAGEHVCRDYYNNADASLKSKIKDFDGTIWHRTGDIVKLDTDGSIFIVGRIHNVIERAGRYLFPVRPEVLLKRIPDVKYGAYLGLPDAKLGEKTACVVALNSGETNLGSAQCQAVKKQIEADFAYNNIPVDEIIFRTSIPMDPRHHSKVEYDVLRKELLNNG